MYNLREAFKEIEAYSTFNREERNCVTILYHSLLLNGNLSRFLSGIGYSIGRGDQIGRNFRGVFLSSGLVAQAPKARRP